ncbi:MAG: type 4a pilus biogenesis protein PilO [Gallionella sp.]
MMPETKSGMPGVAKYFSNGAATPFANSTTRFRWHMRHWLTVLGKPGIVAIGLLVICGSWYLTSIRPLQQRFDDAQRAAKLQQQQNLNPVARITGTKGTPADQLEEFYRFFPVEHKSPELLEKLSSIAQQNGLQLNDGEYKVTRDKAGMLMRLGISLPVRGTYPQIRNFLSSLKTDIPSLVLEKVQFERKNIVDSSVQTKIALALYLVQQP